MKGIRQWVVVISAINCFYREYRPIPHLDTYEGANLDNEEYEALSPGARAEVERQLRKRDRQEGLTSGRMRPGLLYDDAGSEEGEESAPPHARRRRIEREGEEVVDFDLVSCVFMCACTKNLWASKIEHTHLPFQGPEQIGNIEDIKGHSIREWVSMEAPRAEIKNHFKYFLRNHYDDNGVNVYREKIRQMCDG